MQESFTEIADDAQTFLKGKRRFFQRQQKELSEQAKELLRSFDKLFTEQKKDIEKRHRKFIRWLKTKELGWDDVRLSLRRLIAGTTLASLLMVTPFVGIGPAGKVGVERRLLFSEAEFQTMAKERAKEALGILLPTLDHHLTQGEEQTVTLLLSKILPVSAVAELGGNRLNKTWGWMGGEQHLYRYPGDSLAEHMENRDDWAKYYDSGVAPGLGAWGYFASSKAAMTTKDSERERWYVVAQTFLAPGWHERSRELYHWFQYRKMIVLNQRTGQAVVGVLGDSGPAEWTGKSFGGSPEVMEALNIASGPRKGPVLILFLDDPSDTIPLGPIDLGVRMEKGQG
ncbi:MAG: hypothetical protein Q8R11_01135 [bacterium]|nr:hypothetical protein [bacterium]